MVKLSNWLYLLVPTLVIYLEMRLARGVVKSGAMVGVALVGWFTCLVIAVLAIFASYVALILLTIVPKFSTQTALLSWVIHSLAFLWPLLVSALYAMGWKKLLKQFSETQITNLMFWPPMILIGVTWLVVQRMMT